MPPDIPPPTPGKPLKPRPPKAVTLPDPPPLPPPLPPPAELPTAAEDTIRANASDLLEYRKLLAERARRKIEALNLYVPLPAQEEFHRCPSRVRLARGSNRSGKTLSTAVELARAVLARDPYHKYPERDGRAFVVGYDEKHLGLVIHRYLFRSGAFKIVRDETTGEWRSYRPWDPADKAREATAKPAPPLIPPRFVKSMSWTKKSTNVPEKVVLTNGWEIDFFSSKAKPPRGSALDIVWFDEEIEDPEWYPEMSARLLDRAGRMWWGATPQVGTDRLYELHQRCERESEDWARAKFDPAVEPSAREFLLLLRNNPHVDERQKWELAKDLTEAEHAVRVDGDFAVEAAKIYPEFSVRVHGVPYFDVPNEWTRFAVVDPGRQICATLFLAVPPPDAAVPVGVADNGDPVTVRVNDDRYVVLYDELYIPTCDAATFGVRMSQKCQAQQFRAFIIDTHGGRITDIGSGKSVEEQYKQALRENGVKSELTGHGFVWGSDDVEGGLEAVRAWLRVRPSGRPALIVIDPVNRLPNFKWEIERYRYKRDKSGPTDKPEDRGRVHLMACLRYAAMYDPRYHEPPRGSRRHGDAYAGFLRKKRRQAKDESRGGVNLGPPR